MAFAPELDEPVFTEVTPETAPVVVAADQPVPAPAPEVTPVAMVTPVAVMTPVASPEPAAEPFVAEAVAEVEAEATPEPAAEPERIIWYVTGSRVNVREGPSTNYTVLGKVLYGDAAEVISDPDADWVKIRIEGDGVEGYIAKRFMTDVDPLG
ncbi:SH3 domain-containing protein [Profundibacter sp.]